MRRINWGRTLGLIVSLLIVFAVLAYSPVKQAIKAQLAQAQAQRLQAEAERDAARAQVEQARNERMQVRPLAFAAFADTSLNIFYVVADRVLLFALILILALRRWNDETK